MQYYFSIDGTTQQGPVERAQLIAAGVTARTQVWREGLAAWTAAADVPELADLFTPPAAESADAGEPTPASADPPPQSPQQVVVHQMQYEAYRPQAPNSLAVGSMVLGIISLLALCAYGLGGLMGVVAVVLGHLARAQIRRGEGSGDGMAVAGLITGYIAVILVLVFLLVLVAVFVFIGMAATAATKPAPVTPAGPPSTSGGILINFVLSFLPI